MADVLVPIAMFFGAPFVIFVVASWKKEQREREQRRHLPPPDRVEPRSGPRGGVPTVLGRRTRVESLTRPASWTCSQRRGPGQLGYSLQANAKVTEGRQHADRDGQFRYIADLAQTFVDDDEPVISVDTKKKELIGDYANAGTEWAPSGEPERTQVHDFPDPELGEYPKVIPYGIYDIGNNEGWVSVGDTADTAEFAVESIRRWWNTMGRTRFPNATRLMI